MSDRNLLEKAFRDGLLPVLIATSTLGLHWTGPLLEPAFCVKSRGSTNPVDMPLARSHGREPARPPGGGEEHAVLRQRRLPRVLGQPAVADDRARGAAAVRHLGDGCHHDARLLRGKLHRHRQGFVLRAARRVGNPSCLHDVPLRVGKPSCLRCVACT